MSQLDEYAYLWDGSEPGWVLVGSDARYSIAKVGDKGNAILIVEDERLHSLLCERMQAAGCPVLDKLPHRDLVIEDDG